MEAIQGVSYAKLDYGSIVWGAHEKPLSEHRHQQNRLCTFPT